jgi:hypothetical protein
MANYLQVGGLAPIISKSLISVNVETMVEGKPHLLVHSVYACVAVIIHAFVGFSNQLSVLVMSFLEFD